MKEIELGFGYKLERLDSRNWELMHWHGADPGNVKTKSTEPKWHRCGKFYQTLGSALAAAYERVLGEGEDAADLAATAKRCEEIREELLSVRDKLGEVAR